MSIFSPFLQFLLKNIIVFRFDLQLEDWGIDTMHLKEPGIT